jgi:hypothetical protein
MKQAGQVKPSPLADFHLGIQLEPEEKRVILTAEESARKEREAEEARQRAGLTASEARFKVKEAREARRSAIFAAKELLRKERLKTREVKTKLRKAHRSQTISPDDSELLAGKFTLAFYPGVPHGKISNLIRYLSAEPGFRNLGTEGVTGQGSRVKICIGNPLALFWVLYRIPGVRQVAWKKNKIFVDLY